MRKNVGMCAGLPTGENRALARPGLGAEGVVATRLVRSTIIHTLFMGHRQHAPTSHRACRNNEFQTAYEEENQTMAAVDRTVRQLQRLNQQYVDFARQIAEMIVAELAVPAAHRKIKPCETQTVILANECGFAVSFSPAAAFLTPHPT